MSVNAFPASERHLQGTQKALSRERTGSKTKLEQNAGLCSDSPICPAVPDALEASSGSWQISTRIPKCRIYIKQPPEFLRLQKMPGVERALES